MLLRTTTSVWELGCSLSGQSRNLSAPLTHGESETPVKSPVHANGRAGMERSTTPVPFSETALPSSSLTPHLMDKPRLRKAKWSGTHILWTSTPATVHGSLDVAHTPKLSSHQPHTPAPAGTLWTGNKKQPAPLRHTDGRQLVPPYSEPVTTGRAPILLPRVSSSENWKEHQFYLLRVIGSVISALGRREQDSDFRLQEARLGDLTL